MTDSPALLRALQQQSVRFIVIGGAASTAHGSARLTLDLDVVYDRRPENVERLVTALGPFRPTLRGAPEGLPFVWDERTIRSGLNFTLSTSLGALDLLGEDRRAGGHPGGAGENRAPLTYCQYPNVRASRAMERI